MASVTVGTTIWQRRWQAPFARVFVRRQNDKALARPEALLERPP